MKKLLYTLLSIVFLTSVNGQDSQGTEFWLAVPGNQSGSVNLPQLYITAQAAAVVTINIPGVVAPVVVNVGAGALQTVSLPASTQIQTSGISNLGIHVTSTSEITIYSMNARDYSTDAYMALPIDALGLDYYVMGYSPDLAFSIPAQLTIVATENNTTVTINPKALNTEGLPVGVNSNIVLQQGETYQIRSTQFTTAGDFTGSWVSADKPIGVFGGNQCTNIYDTYRACDHLVEQMPPITAWGTSFVSIPLATRLNGDLFRVMAQQANTEVKLNGAVLVTLNAGEFYDVLLPSNSYNRFTSDEPVLLGQFSMSSDFDNTTSDPFFALVPPDDQFLVDYVISSGTGNIPNNYLNITSLTSNIGDVKVDNVVVPGGLWNPIPGTNLSGAKVSVATGVHSVNSILPIGVLAYGYGDYDSYGYLGGQSFSPVAQVNSMDLNLQQVNAIQAQRKCVEATVLDQNNNPVVGVKVDFNIIGVNNLSSFDFTDAQGKITFCYNVCLSGIDTLVASIAGLTDTVIVNIAPSSLSITPLSGIVAQGAQHCITATVLDGSNIPVQGAVVNFGVSGANALNVAIFTDVNGEALFCYNPANSGADNIHVTAGCINGNVTNSTVTVTPSVQNCNFSTSISTPFNPNSQYALAGASDPNTYYWGLSSKYFDVAASGGVAPYSYAWSSTTSFMASANKKRARLWYPRESCWVKVTVTDANGDMCKDSVYVPWVDPTCNQPFIWYYQLCYVPTQTSMCVQGTANMRNLIATGDYYFGTCGNPLKRDADVSLTGLNVFPNPTNGLVTLQYLSSLNSEGNLEVYDIKGSLMYQTDLYLPIGMFEGKLDLSSFSNGIYFIQLNTGKDVLVEKVQVMSN